MNKRLVSLLMTTAMVGAVGTSAYAGGINSSVKSKVVPAQSTQTTDSTSTTQSSSKSNVASDTSKTTKDSTTKTKTAKEGLNYGWIKAQLKSGKTVSQIKSELISNFNAKTSALASKKNLSKEKVAKIEKNFADHLNKTNILKGIISNNEVMKDLNNGQTLKQAETNLINSKTANINKLVSEKKITQDQANKRIDAMKTHISKGNDIFINEHIVREVRKDIDSGKTLAQAKQDIISNADAKAQSLVKEGKIKQADLPKVEQHIQKRIDHNPAFKHISNVNWVQKALENGQTATQIKTDFINKLNAKETKIEQNKNLTQTQISKIKTHISNLQKSISNKSIFSNIMSK